jgi:hypothetical protein
MFVIVGLTAAAGLLDDRKSHLVSLLCRFSEPG